MTLPHPIPYQGSKRKLASTIGLYFPPTIGTFYEPFAGSAAMTIYAAFNQRAARFVIADSLDPLVTLLRAMVESPETTASRYRAVWLGQKTGDSEYFNRIRQRYNERRDHVDLLYLICRCVKNSVRFSKYGRFTQSADKRRLGMHPKRMETAILGTSSILRGRVEFRVGDWLDTTADAGSTDFLYMDPPYSGTSVGRDKRYHQQMRRDDLITGLRSLRARDIRFALSYDGATGGRRYGPPLPKDLGLTQLLIQAGRSSQATLNGRKEETLESLYLTPELSRPTCLLSQTQEPWLTAGVSRAIS